MVIKVCFVDLELFHLSPSHLGEKPSNVTNCDITTKVFHYRTVDCVGFWIVHLSSAIIHNHFMSLCSECISLLLEEHENDRSKMILNFTISTYLHPNA